MSHDLTPGTPQARQAARWLGRQPWPIPAEAFAPLLGCLREHPEACTCLAGARALDGPPRVGAVAAARDGEA